MFAKLTLSLSYLLVPITFVKKVSEHTLEYFRIYFSSDVFTGWVSVTGGRDKEITLKAFTPGGRGCKLRSPSLLEHAVNLKGKRIKGTKMYHPKLKKT